MANKILLVDDDKILRDEFKGSFDEYDIVEAGDGEEAIKMLKKPNDIDLVILDVKMPGMSGTEVLREMRRVSPELGIIILTGYSSKEVAIASLRNHADDYIEKPVDPVRMREVIEKILESRKVASVESASDIKGKIEKVKRFAERNSEKKVSLNNAAEAVCLSPKYLSRIFRQRTGLRFSEYRLTIKIDRAKELLTETNYNVNEISNRMGYENTESFIRIFKKLTGFTPTDFRKKYRKAVTIPKK